MLKKIIPFLQYKLKPFNKSINRVRNFYFTNSIIVFNSRLSIGDSCVFNQKTRFTGAGKITVGDKVTFGYKLGGFFHGAGIELQARTPDSKITIGKNVSTNNNICIISSGSISVGDDCLIGQNVTLMDFDAHGIEPTHRKKVGEIGTIIIGQNVWIGNNVLLLKNAKIGNNSVIAAGAIVTKEFPDNVVIGGIPAKIIKHI
jgi:acetyltransferase-like isoleucine patch superfamily enzyme